MQAKGRSDDRDQLDHDMPRGPLTGQVCVQFGGSDALI
jgi:hypothetical protein